MSQSNKDRSIVYPCKTCAKERACEKKSCPEWRLWWGQKWEKTRTWVGSLIGVDVLPKTDYAGIFARRLRQVRTRKGMTQAMLGEASGTSAGTISHLELGYIRPSKNVVESLSAALGVSAEYLAGDE